MTLDLQSLSLWAGIAASIATTASVVIGWLLIIGRRIKADFDRIEAEMERVEREGKLQTEAANERAKLAESRLADALNEFKLLAAERFATEEWVGKAFESVQASIDRLTNRLDRVLDEGSPRRPGG